MIVKLLTEHHLEFLSLKRGCVGSSESTLVKISNCWKSHATAQILFFEVHGSILTAWIQFKANVMSHPSGVNHFEFNPLPHRDAF